MKKLASLLIVLVTVVGCDSGPTGEDVPPDEDDPDRTVVPYSEGVRLGWDARTRTEVYDGNSSYPRMIRLDNGDLLVAYVHYVGEAIFRCSEARTTVGPGATRSWRSKTSGRR